MDPGPGCRDAVYSLTAQVGHGKAHLGPGTGSFGWPSPV